MMPRATAHRRWFLLVLVLLTAEVCASGPSTSTPGHQDVQNEFRLALEGYRYRFPDDHGAHEQFRTEWWYYTGQLVTETGRLFGYQLTFFRRGVRPTGATNPSRWAIRDVYLAHAALSDLAGGRFHYAEKISRAGLGKAGAEAGHLNVWIDRWRAERQGEGQHLKADALEFSLELSLTPEKSPVVHGSHGVSRKGSGPSDASHYYSMTRVATEGTLWLGGAPFTVRGTTWMDHEFGSGDLAQELAGWDWFSVQLDDNSEMMLYILRRSDGSAHPASSGTLVFADGRTKHLLLSDISLQVLEHWQSPHSGARYPSRWHLALPAFGLDLEVIPRLSDQELRTTRSTQVTYWEGAVKITGTHHLKPVSGQGYVELTGYAAPRQ
jgi:predicted secreted hydrolase